MWKMFPRQRSNNDLLRQVATCEQATGARGGGAGELANRAQHNMQEHDDADCHNDGGDDVGDDDDCDDKDGELPNTARHDMQEQYDGDGRSHEEEISHLRFV